jgi:hypothetical protein
MSSVENSRRAEEELNGSIKDANKLSVSKNFGIVCYSVIERTASIGNNHNRTVIDPAVVFD